MLSLHAAPSAVPPPVWQLTWYHPTPAHTHTYPLLPIPIHTTRTGSLERTLGYMHAVMVRAKLTDNLSTIVLLTLVRAIASPC